MSSNDRRQLIPTFLAITVLAVAAGVAGTMFMLPYATSSIVQKVDTALAQNAGSLPRPRPTPTVSSAALVPAGRVSAAFALAKPAAVDPLTGAYVPGDALAMGVAVTSDGWLASVGDAAEPKGKRLQDVVAVIGGKAHPLERSVRDPHSGVTFYKTSATNLPVVAFGATADLVAGDALFAIDAAQALHRLDVLANEPLPAVTAADALRSSERRQRMVRVAGDASLRGSVVIDARGEIVGLLDGDASGPFGMAVVPAEAFTDVVGSVLRGQMPQRAYLGVQYLDLALLSGRSGEDAGRGALLAASADGKVPAVLKGSPAAAAGLRAGDMIVSIDGEVVSGKNPLADALALYAPGEPVTFGVLRGKATQPIEVNVTLGTVPNAASNR